jgi:hypothetical protein
MGTFKGLIYVKYGRVGTRNEGPDYHLQTAHGDLLLAYHPWHAWEMDYQLEYYGPRAPPGPPRAQCATEVHRASANAV